MESQYEGNPYHVSPLICFSAPSNEGKNVKGKHHGK